jgi:tetratricopeptide (TPR) repeat protein
MTSGGSHPSPSEAETLLQRAVVARREDRPEDARRHYAAAASLCRRTGPSPELVKAIKGLGQIDRDEGREQEAQRLHEEAVDVCRLLDEPFLLAHTIRHLGEIHQDAGRLGRAEPLLLKALALYRAHEDPPTLDLANAVRPLAVLKTATGQRGEARRLWEEARDLYAAVNVREGVSEASAQISRLDRYSERVCP